MPIMASGFVYGGDSQELIGMLESGGENIDVAPISSESRPDMSGIASEIFYPNDSLSACFDFKLMGGEE